jgi:hypothetical protein
MQAFGSDRVRVADDGRVLLSARFAKGWTARVEKTLTTAEFPGTAVLWSDAYYEVIGAEPLPSGGVRYTLLPWGDAHAMRVVDRYDEESETLRLDEIRKAAMRERGRRSANLFGFLTGQLPASVQEALAEELGILPARLTIVSVLFEFALIVGLSVMLGDRLIHEQSLPLSLALLTGFLIIEVTVRFHLAFVQKRPIGTTAGLFAYILFYALAPSRAKLTSPFKTGKGLSVRITDAPEDVALRDAFMMREPLVTLLTAEEQAQATERFGYDYRKHSSNIALIILISAIAGVVSSLSTHAILAGLVAAALAAEQIVRLLAFRRGPAPSVLGWLARPFVRKLLA